MKLVALAAPLYTGDVAAMRPRPRQRRALRLRVSPDRLAFSRLLVRGNDVAEARGLRPLGNGPASDSFVETVLGHAVERVLAGQEPDVLREWCTILREAELDSNDLPLVIGSLRLVSSRAKPSPVLDEPELVDALDALFRALPACPAERWHVRRLAARAHTRRRRTS